MQTITFESGIPQDLHASLAYDLSDLISHFDLPPTLPVIVVSQTSERAQFGRAVIMQHFFKFFNAPRLIDEITGKCVQIRIQFIDDSNGFLQVTGGDFARMQITDVKQSFSCPAVGQIRNQ
jgi:hypothetical protein